MNDFKLYFETGWQHIISPDATDHILFIIALAAIYSLLHIKEVLILVTAFTVGHSLTLALSVTEIISFNSVWIEFLIPVTIVITAIYNLFRKKNIHFGANYFLALFFGLIHGMGFANSIKFMLAKDQNIALPLVSFNLGIEAGQIVLVASILILQFIFVEKIGLKEKRWITFVSVIPLIFGVWMAINRIP